MIWLFDYDLTLYGTEERVVINSLDHRISLFVQKIVGTDFETAHKIRTDYLKKFGTTLAGLMAMHQVKPDDFFDFIHVAEFLTYPKKSLEKRELLLSLPGRRFVFTNGRSDWSDAGLKHIGIRDCFESIFDLKQMDWIGKPDFNAYQKLLQFLEKQNANQNEKIILLDDALRNLEPAKKLGFTTILVNPNEAPTDFVDFKIDHLLDLSKILNQIL